MMSPPNSCVVVRVNVMRWGQVDVKSTQNSYVVCVNVLGWGQAEVSREEIISSFSGLSLILSIPTSIQGDSSGCSQTLNSGPLRCDIGPE